MANAFIQLHERADNSRAILVHLQEVESFEDDGLHSFAQVRFRSGRVLPVFESVRNIAQMLGAPADG